MILTGDLLAGVSAGQLIECVLWVMGAAGVLSTITIKLYRMLEKYRKMRNKSEEDEATLKQHTDNIRIIQSDIKDLVEFNKKIIEVNKIQTRNSIVRICNEALDKGSIDSMQFQALEDSYDMYVHVLNGNSYVSSLVDAVRKLPVKMR